MPQNSEYLFSLKYGSLDQRLPYALVGFVDLLSLLNDPGVLPERVLLVICYLPLPVQLE